MQASPECKRCFQRQALQSAERVGLNERDTEHLLLQIRRRLDASPADETPPVTASDIHALIRDITRTSDPYQEAKSEATAHALSLYPKLKQLVMESDDPLQTAVRLAIAGNIIDLGVSDQYDLEASIERVLTTEPMINHIEQLREALAGAKGVLFLADNAGETVMDRLLIEQLHIPVTYVVKGGPAVNDATREDAIAAGIDKICELIDHGAATLGTLLERCNEQFRQQFNEAELIIAKGMANYESLHGSRAGLFFLLQAKCAVVAADLDVAEKSLIVLQGKMMG
ncbi:MAG: ARMT1-like domain-containing protein [Chromatiales bacterium]|nr:ARMT1-like domain-containing protein [Chromatiales bacterium]